MKRYGSMIGLRPDKIEEYRRLHAAVWPEILSNIKECHMSSYSIVLHQLPEGNHYLFSYLEYTGVDIKADSARMAANPKVQDWWALCKPCQEPLSNRAEGDWRSNLEEVFHAN